MPSLIQRSEELFLDTAYAIALSSGTDAYHARALELAEAIETQNARLVMTLPVLLEIGNSLSRVRYRAAAVRLLEAVEQDARIDLVLLTEELYARGLRLFRERLDKEWSLTDCISFIVMQDRGISRALTTDHHFVQAGFQALLG